MIILKVDFSFVVADLLAAQRIGGKMCGMMGG